MTSDSRFDLRRAGRVALPLVAVTALLSLAGSLLPGCSSSDSPAAPLAPANAITSAHVLLGGQPVEGTVVSGGDRGPTRFEVRLRDRDRESLGRIESIRVHYDVPRMGMMGQNRRGDALCYDDGSHGDDVAGDGIYHCLDDDDRFGCGRAGMAGGSHGYTFRCRATDGSACGEMALGVTRR